jgi:hypothetical protein
LSKDKYVVLRGEMYFSRLTGKAQPHTGLPKYDKGPYWSVDLVPDAKSKVLMKEFGILNKLKSDKEGKDHHEGKKFLGLRHLENRKDGSKNDPVPVKDAAGELWPDKVNIGNQSIGDVKVKVVDYEGAEKGVYIQAVRVLKHVPYEKEDFEPLSEDDEFFAGAADERTIETSIHDTDLDDDVPF